MVAAPRLRRVLWMLLFHVEPVRDSGVNVHVMVTRDWDVEKIAKVGEVRVREVCLGAEW